MPPQMQAQGARSSPSPQGMAATPDCLETSIPEAEQGEGFWKAILLFFKRLFSQGKSS